MVQIGQPCTAGDWLVKGGSETDFREAWTASTEWSRQNAPGAESFFLIQQNDNPRHSYSFGFWRDADSVAAWRQRPEFAERFGR